MILNHVCQIVPYLVLTLNSCHPIYYRWVSAVFWRFFVLSQLIHLFFVDNTFNSPLVPRIAWVGVFISWLAMLINSLCILFICFSQHFIRFCLPAQTFEDWKIWRYCRFTIRMNGQSYCFDNILFGILCLFHCQKILFYRRQVW